MFAWSPWSLPGLFAGLVLVGIAAVVLAQGPSRTQNRALAFYLVVVATNVGVGIWGGLALSLSSAHLFYGALLVQFVSAVLFFPAYTGFLRTIDTPLSRPFRTRSVHVSVWSVAGIMALLFLSRPTLFFSGIVAAVVAGTWAGVPTAYAMMFQTSILVLYLFGLAVAVSAYRRARTPVARRQMTAYLVAFGVYDALIVTLVILTLTPAWLDGAPAARMTGQLIPPIASLFFASALAYGVLHTQMFDIDLKIKWTINRGSLVGVFLAVFFIVGVIAENWLTDRFGLAFGGVAAGLLLFALAPLRRMADRVADTAMPHVRDDEEYRTVRKRDVYLAALEGALVDDIVSDRERDMLARLQDQLGLSATEARSLELLLTAPKEVT